MAVNRIQKITSKSNQIPIGRIIHAVASGKFIPRTRQEKVAIIRILLAVKAGCNEFSDDLLTYSFRTEQDGEVIHLAEHLDLSPKQALTLLKVAYENLDLVIEQQTERKAYKNRIARFIPSLN